MQPSGNWQERVYGAISLTSQLRRKPGAVLRRQILDQQEDRCFYCGLPFGGVIHRKGKPVTLQLHWDHVVPFSYSVSNQGTNFVAACHVCNLIKGDFMFETSAKAIEYIERRRFEKGYRITPGLRGVSA